MSQYFFPDVNGDMALIDPHSVPIEGPFRAKALHINMLAPRFTAMIVLGGSCIVLDLDPSTIPLHFT